MFESCKQTFALLSRRREIGAHPAESLHAFSCSETARDFLLQFQHPQVALRTVVIEGNFEVGHKAQHFSFVFDKTVEQLSGGESGTFLFGRTAHGFFGLGGQRVVTGEKHLLRLAVQFRSGTVSSRLNRFLELDEQLCDGQEKVDKKLSLDPPFLVFNSISNSSGLRYPKPECNLVLL